MSLFRGSERNAPPLKEKGPKDIGNNMTMVQNTRKSNTVSQQRLQFHIWFLMNYSTLLQNVTDNITKRETILLQNASCCLLHNHTGHCNQHCAVKRNHFVIPRSLICNCSLLKDISFNKKCFLVWCD